MRPWALAFLSLAFLTISSSAIAQQPPPIPVDGNGLLQYCSHILGFLDSPMTQGSTHEQIVENVRMSWWCAGYLEGSRDVSDRWLISLAFAGTAGNVTERDQVVREFVIPKNLVCIPDGVPTTQLARVIVKWLRDHPDRLHEQRSALTQDALQDNFPCQRDAQKEENRQQR